MVKYSGIVWIVKGGLPMAALFTRLLKNEGITDFAAMSLSHCKILKPYLL